MTRLSLLLALAACSASEDAPAPDKPDTGTPSDTDVATIEVDLDEASAAAQRAVDLLSDMSAQPLVNAYTYLMKDVEPTCPNYTEVEGGNHFWDGACTTSTGAFYHGAAFYYRLDQTELGGVDLGGLTGVIAPEFFTPGTVVSGEGFFGQIDSATQEGEAFRCSCRGVALSARSPAGDDLWFNHTYGPITWGGADAASSWLGSDQRAHLSQLARYTPSTGRRARTVSGILNGMASPYTSVDLQLSFDVTGADACTREPVGKLKVRDRFTGYWIEVVFDVEMGTQASDPLCDGCGAASLNGAAIGNVCADFTALTSFDNAPW
jgi:hypothetical protein